MSSPRIYDLAFDDENEEKLARRGISPEDALDVIEQPYTLVKNKRRRGLYKIIGRDGSSRGLTIIIESTAQKTTWRPVTGWPSTDAEARQLVEGRGHGK